MKGSSEFQFAKDFYQALLKQSEPSFWKILIKNWVPLASNTINTFDDMSAVEIARYKNKYEKAFAETRKYYINLGSDLEYIKKTEKKLVNQAIDTSIVAEFIITNRNMGSAFPKNNITLSPSQEKLRAELSSKSDTELVFDAIEALGQAEGIGEARALIALITKNNQGNALQQKQNPQPSQNKDAEATKAPSTALKPKPAIKPVDSSGPANLAEAIENKILPAMESMQTLQTASNIALDDNQTKVGALSETYSWYASSLLGAAESMNSFAQAEKNVVETQSITGEVLATELDKAQLSVDKLAGKSLVDMSNAFAGAIVKGQNFGETLKSIGENILYTIIQMQALSWITSLFGFGGSSSSSSSFQASSFSSPYGAWGSVVSGLFGGFQFAKGGVVSQPTLFGFSKGIGLMGEAGAEAIMPLGRDSRGNLGVRVADGTMSGAGTGGVFAPHVEINVENKGGGDMSEEQARSLGTQVKAIVEMQVAKQMYEYMRNGTLRPSMGRGY